MVFQSVLVLLVCISVQLFKINRWIWW